MALINLLLKPKCMLKDIFEFFLCFMYKKNDMIFFFIFERLGCMHENKKKICFIIFLQCFDENRHFKTGFVSLRYKNTNQYYTK
jgi:hypothetical protein